MSNDDQFYKNLTPFTNFSEITENIHFKEVPDNWNIVITDIKGSTQAIHEGRYKDVNLIGAATITCTLNTLPHIEIPFVFGGDGSTLLIPNIHIEETINELKKLQHFSQTQFNLKLRVGYVSVGELKKMGDTLSVGKYELSAGNYTAQFKGGALSLAENMVKKESPIGAHIVNPNVDESKSPNLSGLSCRLEPLQNQKGTILSILVKPNDKNDETSLKEILAELKKILNGDLLSARPISVNRLIWKWPPASLKSEVKTQKQNTHIILQWLKTGLNTLIAHCMLNFNISAGGFKPELYKSRLVNNSDFKKFDETLRMVIDCSQEQSLSIENLLTQYKDKITYGLFKSSSALITCMVKSATSNQHMHFIDGADGGYALAASQMKKQTT